MAGVNILTIVLGTTRENRAATVAEILTWKRKSGRVAQAVAGFTTGAPASDEDAKLFTFVTEKDFARMERFGEFAHVDQVDGIRYGYRFTDLDAAIKKADGVIVFNEFVEAVDRSALAPLKCAKRVVNPQNETQRLTLTSYGDINMRDRPAN